MDRREIERTVRMRTVGFERWVRGYGLGPQDVAERIGMLPGTLREWMAGWIEDRLRIEVRGRPAERSDRWTRQLIIAMFHLMGPGVGLPTLQAIFPEIARAELEELLARYRDVHRKRTSLLVYVLKWKRGGTVWAMDYTKPPAPVDGTYGGILVVRDLATGNQLLALPVEGESARATRDALEALFLVFGPPLVMKSDNGSPLVAEEVQQLLEMWGTLQLLSPPGTPEYNGACEAGIGSLKTRAHHEAARNDRPGEWTCDDVEGARMMANETGRPWGATGLTPKEAWERRSPIKPEEREELLLRVRELREEARREQGHLPGMEIGPADEASVERVAISRALVELGLLDFRRRRIPLPFFRLPEVKIS